MAALTLFPLQVDQLMPIYYPDQLAAMFHPMDSISPTYTMCPWIRKVEEDNYQIVFRYPLKVNMRKFSKIKLVGCSKYENKILCNAIAEYVHHKIGHHLTWEQLDPLDNLVMEQASMAVVLTMMGSSIEIHSKALLEQFFKVPTGELYDMYAASIGAADPKRISINLLRAIPNHILYSSALSGLIEFYLNCFGLHEDKRAIDRLSEIAPHNSPLSRFFGDLITAGLTPQLIDGAKSFGLLQVPLNISAE